MRTLGVRIGSARPALPKAQMHHKPTCPGRSRRAPSHFMLGRSAADQAATAWWRRPLVPHSTGGLPAGRDLPRPSTRSPSPCSATSRSGPATCLARVIPAPRRALRDGSGPRSGKRAPRRTRAAAKPRGSGSLGCLCTAERTRPALAPDLRDLRPPPLPETQRPLTPIGSRIPAPCPSTPRPTRPRATCALSTTPRSTDTRRG